MNTRLSLGTIALGAAVAGISVARYRRHKQQAVNRILFGSQAVATDTGSSINYAIEGQGPHILISHGAGGGYDQGLLIAQAFQDRHNPHYTILAPSRFGYIRTPLPDNTSPQTQADFYADLLDLLNIPSAAVVSYSAGGPAALQFALRYPDRCWSLVMISSMSHHVRPAPALFKMMFQSILCCDLVAVLWGKLVADKMWEMYGIHPDALAQYKQDPEVWPLLRGVQEILFPIRLRRNGIFNDFEQAVCFPRAPLGDIRVPTLVVHGDNDPVVPLSHANLVAGQVPNAEQVIVQGGSHFCLFTHRQQVGPAVTAFLKQHAPSTSDEP